MEYKGREQSKEERMTTKDGGRRQNILSAKKVRKKEQKKLEMKEGSLQGGMSKKQSEKSEGRREVEKPKKIAAKDRKADFREDKMKVKKQEYRATRL